MSEEAHVAAVVAAVNAKDGRAYTIDDLKKMPEPPQAYNEVYVMRRLSDAPNRVGGLNEGSQWRVITRAVGKHYTVAQAMRDRANAALHDTTLVVDGETYYPRRALGDDPIGPDDGWFSGTSEFQY